jgi:hypothetical protein
MATTVFRNNFVQFIPPDGTHFFTLGPHDLFGSGAINVTAHSTDNVSLQPNFVEVIQMATRRSIRAGGGNEFRLDIVVRNNAHVGGPGAGFSNWVAYTSVATP